jgi:hypothetical protein
LYNYIYRQTSIYIYIIIIYREMEYNPDVLDDIPARIMDNRPLINTNNDSIAVDINDIRMSQDFRGVSFSGYKIADVRTQLVNSLLNSKLNRRVIGVRN